MTNKSNNSLFETERLYENGFPFWAYYVYSPESPLHWHDFMEIGYSNGKGVVTVNNVAHELGPGDILFVSPGTLHQISVAEGHMHFFVFDLELLRFTDAGTQYDKLISDLVCRYKRFKETIPHDCRLAEIMRPMLDELSVWSERDIPVGPESCRIMAKLFNIFAACIEEEIFETVDSSSVYSMKYIEVAMKYIGEHYTENIKIEDIADCLNISSTYLYRLFREYVGTTPINYINSLRLHEAYKCLSDGMNVTETANAVGISNISYFIRLFKTATGQTPTKWQRERFGKQ